MAFSIEDARQIAICHGYNEIHFHEQTRVLSFQKEETRIDIHCATGIVATFRRNKSTKELEGMFQHSGFVRRHHSKNEKQEVHRIPSRQCSVVSRSPSTYEKAHQIAACYKLWTQLRFGPDASMEHRSSNVHPENSREADKAYSCYCVLVRVLCSVALKVDSKKLVPALFHFPSRHQDLENCTKEDCEDDYFHAIPFQAFADCSCEEGIQYETTHALELQILEHQLLSFPKAVQRKLIHFLFQELCPSYCLVLRGETDGGKYKVYQGSLYAD